MKLWNNNSRQRGGIFAKLAALIVIVMFCALIYLVRRPLLRLAGEYWIVSDPLETSDAIVILSDDDYTADRAAHAADLFHAGWAPRIIASGEKLRPYFSISQLMQHDLELRNVPEKAIVLFPHQAPDTLVELEDIEQFVAERGWHHIIIVTSNYHTRRTRYLARRIFPHGFDVRVEAAPDVNFDPTDWWQSREGLKLFFHEYVGMIVAIWEIHHRPARTAGGQPSGQALIDWPKSPFPLLSLVYTDTPLYYSAFTALIA
jgi:uncharacterized SAM-binding protein YcdF (DUF218 family)